MGAMSFASRVRLTTALLLVLPKLAAAQHAPSLSIGGGLGISHLSARAMSPESVLSGSLDLALAVPVADVFGADLTLSLEGSRRRCNCDFAGLQYSVDGEIMRSVPFALYGGLVLLGAHADLGSVRIVASAGRGYLSSSDPGGPTGSRATATRIDFVIFPESRRSFLVRGEGGELIDYGGQRVNSSAVLVGIRFH